MSHPFGDLVSRYLHRKHGLSQAALAAGICQPPSVISLMCQGQRLSGRGARARVLAIITWLHARGVITEVGDAQALLAAAGLPGFDPVLPDDAQLLHALHDAAPPVPATASPPPALPAALSSFLGREGELATAVRLLQATRLLTLTGPGGVGKTRLALELAAALQGDFADGVGFVSLATIGDPALVASAIAHALQLREVPGRPLVDTLQAHLRTRHLLLVLDNFEHLLPAGPLIAQLLAAAPHLTVLVTSRAPLHLSGEQEFPVPPLAVPTLQESLAPDALTRYAALTLFVQRAQAVQPAFELTPANACAVARICVRLDGLPLAIELAAARTKLLPPEALLKRLGSEDGQRLHLLTGGAQDVSARQQTLRGTIDWSYNLLDPTEQRLVQRLGVFVGGFTLDAVEGVCTGAGGCEGDVLDGLQSLVDKSLVRQQAGVDGEPRFTMLEMIREYALERLEAAGEAVTIRRRHAAYFLGLAEQFEPQLNRGAEQLATLARAEADQDNFRAALACAARTDPDLGGRLALALYPLWTRRGYLSEGFTWIMSLLASDGPITMATRAKLLALAADVIWRQGNFEQARVLAEESLGLFHQLDDDWGIARVWHTLGAVAQFTGDFARAAALYGQALALFRAHGDGYRAAWALFSMGHASMVQGDLARAGVHLEESATLFQAQGVLWGLAHVRAAQAEVAVAHGALAEAGHYAMESLTLSREQGWQPTLANALYALGRIEDAAGNYPGAAELYRQSLRQSWEQGDRNWIIRCLVALAGATRAQGQDIARLQCAARLLGTAAALGDQLKIPLEPVRRMDYEASVTALRAQLGETAFATAFAEGRALALEQAIASFLDPAQTGDTTGTGATSLPRAPSSPATSLDPATEKPMREALAPPTRDRLTVRETEVLRLVVHGLTNAEVADKLVISPRTVERHLGSIYRKLQVNTRTAATRYAIAHHLV